MKTKSFWSNTMAVSFRYLRATWVVKVFVNINEEYYVSVILKAIYDDNICFEKTGNFNFRCKRKSKA